MRGGGGCGVSAYEYSCAQGAQINFGALTPYLTYAPDPLPTGTVDGVKIEIEGSIFALRGKRDGEMCNSFKSTFSHY